MSKKILLDAFYGQFSDFLTQLSDTFPDDTDFPLYRTQLLLLKKANPTLAMKEAAAYLCPIEHLLRARDAESFLTGVVPDEIASQDNLGSMVDKLRSYWRTMTPENQSAVWSYLLLLTEIAKRYSA